MITIENNCFVLETAHTAYAFDVSGGVLRHLYYGSKLRRLEDYALTAPRPLFAPGNAAVLDRFDMEVMSGESVIYMLDPALYQSVKYAGGLIPLAEIFNEAPAGAIDEYGIRLGDTQLYKSFSVLQALPEDTVLCLRRVTTMAVIKGKEKTERMHAWHVDLFEKMVTFSLESE